MWIKEQATVGPKPCLLLLLLSMVMPWGASEYLGPQGTEQGTSMARSGTDVNTRLPAQVWDWDQLFFLADQSWRWEDRRVVLQKWLCHCTQLLLTRTWSFKASSPFRCAVLFTTAEQDVCCEKQKLIHPSIIQKLIKALSIVGTLCFSVKEEPSPFIHWD